MAANENTASSRRSRCGTRRELDLASVLFFFSAFLAIASFDRVPWPAHHSTGGYLALVGTLCLGYAWSRWALSRQTARRTPALVSRSYPYAQIIDMTAVDGRLDVDLLTDVGTELQFDRRGALITTRCLPSLCIRQPLVLPAEHGAAVATTLATHELWVSGAAISLRTDYATSSEAGEWTLQYLKIDTGDDRLSWMWAPSVISS